MIKKCYELFNEKYIFLLKIFFDKLFFTENKFNFLCLII